MKDVIHRFQLSGGEDVYSAVDFDGTKVINISWATPENGIYLSLSDAAMLSMLAMDLYNGIVRRIDRPRDQPFTKVEP